MNSTGAAKVQLVTDGSGISGSDLLALLPYGPGFLFIDEFLEVDSTHAVARYRFRPDEFFFGGHFRDRAVTPGVILLEAMCQVGLAAHGLYLLAHETGMANAKRYRFLLTSSEVEWHAQVRPGDLVTIHGELLAWRHRRIRTRVTMFDEADALVAESRVSAMGVLWNSEVPLVEPANQNNSEQETEPQSL